MYRKKKNSNGNNNHNNNNATQKKNLNRFGIISAIIFTFIVIISLIYMKSCNDDIVNCGNVFVQSIHVIILSAGLIGLGYCILVLKGFETKIDPVVEYNMREIVQDLNDNNNNRINGDNNNNLTENNKKVDIFF